MSLTLLSWTLQGYSHGGVGTGGRASTEISKYLLLYLRGQVNCLLHIPSYSFSILAQVKSFLDVTSKKLSTVYQFHRKDYTQLHSYVQVWSNVMVFPDQPVCAHVFLRTKLTALQCQRWNCFISGCNRHSGNICDGIKNVLPDCRCPGSYYY